MRPYKKFKVQDGPDWKTVDIPRDIAEAWISQKGKTYSDYIKFFIEHLDAFLQALEEDRKRRKRY